MNDTRIKLYPDGMDLTSMLFGTEQQVKEAYPFRPEYTWSVLRDIPEMLYYEPKSYKPIRSYYYKYLSNTFVLEKKLPGLRLRPKL